MNDLASTVLSQLRQGDGHTGMSALQGNNRSRYILVTPVVQDGKTSFDIRMFHDMVMVEEPERFRGVEGVNFSTAEQAAAFVASHAQTMNTGEEKAYLRFVKTIRPTSNGGTHLLVDLRGGLDLLTQVLNTLSTMRPLQYKHPGRAESDA